MEKRTLKFEDMINLAMFSKTLSSGFLMNTNNFTITGTFTPQDIATAEQNYAGALIQTTDKVFGYGVL